MSGNDERILDYPPCPRCKVESGFWLAGMKDNRILYFNTDGYLKERADDRTDKINFVGYEYENMTITEFIGGIGCIECYSCLFQVLASDNLFLRFRTVITAYLKKIGWHE